MHFVTFSILVCCSLGLSWASEWGYPDLDNNKDAPFPDWGGLCDSGKRQSPINLAAKWSLRGKFDELKFQNYRYTQKNLEMVNNGHSIQIDDFDDVLVMEGGGLAHEYELEQIHLHWWSEHTINSVRYPLEVHIVHRNKLYPNMTIATNFKDGIVVLGVLFHVSNTPNDAIASIIKNLEDVRAYSRINKPVTVSSSLAVDDLMPQSTGNYYTYAGSLTTPSCAEAVIWIVFTETLPVTLEQVEQFKEIEYSNGKQLHNNFRNLQSINNRAVVLVELDDNRSGAAAGRTASLGLILILGLAAQKFVL
ncbi:putative carbonic anhydrase 3 [Drosophila miranda]|uniref:putative carbonic anhydrase 3 n=1 Tax=Drosophila miranda TaxID=7229 RepID=UPI0007E77301|nr:putative carbonic anhydrase 3 [Drosophila miranda]